MRKIFILAMLVFMIIVVNGQTNHIIQVSDFNFSPATLSIALDDTVTWQWVEGTHTTTSDSASGQNSWNAPISSGNPTFSFVLQSPGLHRYYCIPHGGPGGSGMAGTITVENPVSVESENSGVLEYNLHQNYPNPFNPETMIRLSIPTDGEVTVRVFDLLGQLVAELFSGHLSAGNHEFTFNASSAVSGIYFYKAEAKGEDGSEFTFIRKMTLLR